MSITVFIDVTTTHQMFDELIDALKIIEYQIGDRRPGPALDALTYNVAYGLRESASRRTGKDTYTLFQTYLIETDGWEQVVHIDESAINPKGERPYTYGLSHHNENPYFEDAIAFDADDLIEFEFEQLANALDALFVDNRHAFPTRYSESNRIHNYG